MAGFRKPEIPREQLVLWSQRLDDALPVDHPARLIDELFCSEAFTPVFEAWEGEYDRTRGQPAYHPRDLAMLYCYGLLCRLRSSRLMESACHNRIDVIWLLSGQKPDHATIAAFVSEHGERVSDLFRRVVRVGIRAGLVRLEHAAIDGTVIEADAGRGSVRREATILEMDRRLEAQIRELEAEYQDNERRDGSLLLEMDRGLDEQRRLAALGQKRARLREALAAIDRRASEIPSGRPKSKRIGSTTDPDSRVMPGKQGVGSRPAYNAQVVVDTSEKKDDDDDDGSAGMIIAAEVTDQASDSGQLVSMIDQTERVCGRVPDEVSADAGYNTGRELTELERRGINAYVDDKRPASLNATAREAMRDIEEGRTLSLAQVDALPVDSRTGLFARSCFVHDAGDGGAGVYRCPGAQVLTPFKMGKRYDRAGPMNRTLYRTAACAGCDLASRCCKDPQKGREVSRVEFEDAKDRMREKMKRPEHRTRYRLRCQSVEPRIGTLKTTGLRRFLRRGREKVRSEWLWMCTALNVGILVRHWSRTRTALN